MAAGVRGAAVVPTRPVHHPTPGKGCGNCLQGSYTSLFGMVLTCIRGAVCLEGLCSLGLIKICSTGRCKLLNACFVCMVGLQRASPPGVFIVLLGLVRVDVERPGGRIERRFVGVGGSVGIVPSVVRRDVPGFGLVAAYGQVSCDAFFTTTRRFCFTRRASWSAGALQRIAS